MPNKKRNLIVVAAPEPALPMAGMRPGQADDTVVSFSVGAKLALERDHISCLFPDDLVEVPDLNAIGMENMALANEICAVIDDELRARLAFFRAHGIDLFRHAFFPVKIFFDSLITSYLIFAALLNHAAGGRTTVIAAEYALGRIIGGEHPLVPALAEKVFMPVHEGVSVRRVGRNKAWPDRKDDYREWAGLLKSCWRSWPRGAGKAGKQGGVILLDDRYDVKVWADYCRGEREFYKLFFLPRLVALKSLHSRRVRTAGIVGGDGDDRDIAAAFRAAEKELAGHRIFRGHASLCRFAFACLEGYLRFSLGKNITGLGTAVRKLLADESPLLLCTAACRMDLKDALIMGVAKSLGVPVATYQEGGGAGYLDWPLFNLDAELADYFFVYGEGVAASPFFDGRPAGIIPVGSPYLAEVEQRLSTAKRDTRAQGIYIVLDNIKTGTWQHYPFNGGAFFQAYRHQERILRAVGDTGSGRFILKTVRGRENLYASHIGAGDRLRMETRPLEEVLGGAAAFILDYPSTVLQECLLTDKPIALLLDGNQVRLEAAALELLRRRVRIAFDAADFPMTLAALQADVQNGNPMTKNRDFLRRYSRPEKDISKINAILWDAVRSKRSL